MEKYWRIRIQGYLHTSLNRELLEEQGFIVNGGVFYYTTCDTSIQAITRATIRFELVTKIHWKDCITYTPYEV